MKIGQIVVMTFWMSLVFLVYTYIGYPFFTFMRRYWQRQPVQKDVRYTPRISFLIVAYNEEKVMRSKLENALDLEYQGPRPEIVVASDGANDRTNEIVHEFSERGVVLLPFPSRKGKAQVLNQAIPRCHGEIVILSDSRQIYDSAAVRELVANFNDPKIGAVTGNLQFHSFSDKKDVKQIGLYWGYEKWIRELQSESDSTPVVTGAIYAIRKSLFRSLPVNCIADDLAVPMSIIMQNYRVIYDPTAKAYDSYLRTFRAEFRRRVRTIAGSYQYLINVPSVWNPKKNRIWLDFISHKVCRVLAPFALLALLITNIAMTDWVYRIILVFHLTFYLAAGLGAILARRGNVPGILSGPYTFLMLNVAASVALYQMLTGTQLHLWEKTEV